MASDERPAILYVDDEEGNLTVFRANFASRFNILTASSGRAGLEMVERHPDDFALIAADQRMPQMTGAEFLEAVKSRAPHATRVMISAYSDLKALLEAVNKGNVSRYFLKPWQKEDLQAAMEDAVRIHRLRHKLEDVESRLLQSFNLIAIGQVSAGIAHELINPITYVTQNVEYLKDDLETLMAYSAKQLPAHPDKEVTQALEDLPTDLQDLVTGVKHIRQVASTIRSQARGADVEDVSEVSEIASLAVKLAGASLRDRGRVSMKGQPVRVKGGPVALSQVFLNLLVNAGHAVEDKKGDGLIQLAWEPVGDRVEVTVRDNGCGIPPENLERIFEPLFTTKPAGVGTGLGLSICRQLVREAGGEISATSTVGAGTTFRVVLPKA